MTIPFTTPKTLRDAQKVSLVKKKVKYLKFTAQQYILITENSCFQHFLCNSAPNALSQFGIGAFSFKIL